MSSPSAIHPLLCCPLCPSQSILVSPTTLRCGHTVCAAHIQHDSSACPLPVCPPDSSVGLIIHPDSAVIYHPAVIPPSPLNEPTFNPNEPAVDITVNKLIRMLSGLDTTVASISSRRHGETDSEAEDDLPDPLPSPTPDLPSRASEPSPSSHPRPSTDSSGSSPRSARRQIRRRRQESSDDGIPDPQDKFDKELLTELTCEICFMLFYQPVTTPCQHTFCAKCLQRSLDHNTHCPMCRRELPDYAFFQEHPCNKVVLSVILHAYPEVYAERGHAVEAAERDARLDTPIFVCQLSFPGIPTVLHFFEPRYRLMLRRCLESPTPRFGMVMPPSNASTQDFGTMLQIRSVRMLPDGRSMVHTWGVSRFRILEKGSLDGYMVGRTEAIEDYAEELDYTTDELSIDQVLQQCAEPLTSSASGEGPLASSSAQGSSSSSGASSSSSAQPTSGRLVAPPSNEAMMTKCIEFVEELRQGAAPWIVQKMNESYGPMPTNPSDFSFWMALVLPIDDQEKSKLLPIKSPRLRLRLVVHWVDQLKSNWWFTSGCAIV